MKSTYIMKYRNAGNEETLTVELELLINEGSLNQRGNIYHGVLKINNKISNEFDLSTTVNAYFSLAKISKILKERIVNNSKNFKLISEELI